MSPLYSQHLEQANTLQAIWGPRFCHPAFVWVKQRPLQPPFLGDRVVTEEITDVNVNPPFLSLGTTYKSKTKCWF